MRGEGSLPWRKPEIRVFPRRENPESVLCPHGRFPAQEAAFMGAVMTNQNDAPGPVCSTAFNVMPMNKRPYPDADASPGNALSILTGEKACGPAVPHASAGAPGQWTGRAGDMSFRSAGSFPLLTNGISTIFLPEYEGSNMPAILNKP